MTPPAAENKAVRPEPVEGRTAKPSAIILVLYDSRGLTAELAQSIIAGARSIPGAPSFPNVEVWDRPLDQAQQSDLLACDALILGSPNWSGLTGKLKDWLDHTGDLWESGDLAGKFGACFTTSWSRSAGTEATLLQLIHLLLAHGLIIVGLPWSDAMREAGSYYGATAHGHIRDVDRRQAEALGRRVAHLAVERKRGMRQTDSRA